MSEFNFQSGNKDPELERLLGDAKLSEMTPEEREAQRQSFAYGNVALHNSDVTREMVAEQAAKQYDENGTEISPESLAALRRLDNRDPIAGKPGPSSKPGPNYVAVEASEHERLKRENERLKALLQKLIEAEETMEDPREFSWFSTGIAAEAKEILEPKP